MTGQTLNALNPTEPDAASTGMQIAVLAALSSIRTLATNILLPSLPQMAASLRVTTPAVTASITVFLLVFAFGQLLAGPISDRYGRRTPVLAGFVVFIGGSVWCGLAHDLPTLLAGRANKRPVPVRLQYFRGRSPVIFLPVRH
jgi:DHA1 family bicyclomycin/chloramphenicol resistance-like MFS transporter